MNHHKIIKYQSHTKIPISKHAGGVADSTNKRQLEPIECLLLLLVHQSNTGTTLSDLALHLNLAEEHLSSAMKKLIKKNLVIPLFSSEKDCMLFSPSSSTEETVRSILQTWRELTGQSSINESDIRSIMYVFSAIHISCNQYYSSA